MVHGGSENIGVSYWCCQSLAKFGKVWRGVIGFRDTRVYVWLHFYRWDMSLYMPMTVKQVPPYLRNSKTFLGTAIRRLQVTIKPKSKTCHKINYLASWSILPNLAKLGSLGCIYFIDQTRYTLRIALLPSSNLTQNLSHAFTIQHQWNEQILWKILDTLVPCDQHYACQCRHSPIFDMVQAAWVVRRPMPQSCKTPVISHSLSAKGCIYL